MNYLRLLSDGTIVSLAKRYVKNCYQTARFKCLNRLFCYHNRTCNEKSIDN